MAFCQSCGTKLDDGAVFCQSCGAKQEAPASAPAVRTYAQSAAPDASDAEKNKAMAVLAYCGPLVLIPIFAAKDSKFARFHANQGFTLLIAWVAAWILFGLLSLIKVTKTLYIYGVAYGTYRATPGIIGVIDWIISVAIAVFAVIGIINAVKGRTKELPVVGKYNFLDLIIK